MQIWTTNQNGGEILTEYREHVIAMRDKALVEERETVF